MTKKKKTQKKDEGPADAPGGVTEQQVRDALAVTFTPEATELILRTLIRSLGNVAPLDALAVGEGHQVLAWALAMAEGNFA